MRKTIVIKRKIIKGGKLVGETGHEVKKGAKKAIRIGSRRGGKELGSAAHELKKGTKKQIRMGAHSVVKLGKKMHEAKIVSKRKVRKVIRRA